MPELQEEAPSIKKSDLLGIKTSELLADVIFPESKGFKRKAKRGPQGEIIVIVDDLQNELHLHQVDVKPKKSDFTNRGDWSRNEKYKFFFQPGKNLLILGKDSDLSGEIVFRHTRAEWTRDGLTRSFVGSLGELQFGQSAPFEDLLQRKEVTEEFYNDWVAHISAVTRGVSGVPENRKSEIGRLVAQRLLFLHFIQSKNLLNGNPHFMRDHARQAGKDVYPAFKQVFFNCLNKEGRNKLGLDIPYLNGGLFRETDLELEYPAYSVQNKPFEEFLEFLGGGRWNWHLDEHAPDESEDAKTLDPGLLGHIFEKSVNQKDAGAYYTSPRLTRYMSERAVWGYLGGKLQPPCRPDELVARLGELSKPDLWRFAREHLATITVLDNACGSGAFLLAALDVLRGVWKIVLQSLGPTYQTTVASLLSQAGGKQQSLAYNLSKWLISKNIYGVDLEEGAVEIARLRLWLALITHAPNTTSGIEPLPNIDYNLRCGNSLIGYTRFQGSLAVLEADHVRLLDPIDSAVIPQSARVAWKAGSMLVDALRLRGSLVDAYRFEPDARRARDMRHALERFDAQVGDHIEKLWEGHVERSIRKAKGPDPEAQQLMTDYRRLRDTIIRPFHWFLEFPLMMQTGPSVIIANPPWETVVARPKEFLSNVLNEDTRNMRKAEIDKWLQQVLAEQKNYVPQWNNYTAAVEVQRTILGRMYKLQKGLDVDGNTKSSDLNFYKLFFERWFDLQTEPCYSVICPSGLYTDVSTNSILARVWTQAAELIGLRKMSDHFPGVGANYRCCIVLSYPVRPKSPLVTFKVETIESIPSRQFPWPLPLNQAQGIFEVSTRLEYDAMQVIRNHPRLTTWKVEFGNDLHTTGDMGSFTKTKTKVPVIQGGHIEQFNENFEPPTEYYSGIQPPESRKGRICLRRAGIAPNADVRSAKACIITDKLAKDSCFVETDPGKITDTQRQVLVAFLNSFLADYQLRAVSGTNISLGNLAKVHIPNLDEVDTKRIVKLVERLEEFAAKISTTEKGDARRLSYVDSNEWAEIDAILLRACGLTKAQVETLLAQFPEMGRQNPTQVSLVLRAFEKDTQ